MARGLSKSMTMMAAVLATNLFLGAIAKDTHRYTFYVENLEHGRDGRFTVEVYPDWAPKAAHRFRELVENNFFDAARFFRVIPGFVAQFGIPGDPWLASEWCDKTIPDEPKKKENSRGTISFYKDGPNTRSTQIVISTKDNNFLDDQEYVPFGQVVEGMFIVDRVYDRYGSSPFKPEQIKTLGNAWLQKEFPKLTYIKTVVETPVAPSIPDYQGGLFDAMPMPTHMLIDVVAIFVLIAVIGFAWATWGSSPMQGKFGA